LEESGSRACLRILFNDVAFDDPAELGVISLQWKQGKCFAVYPSPDEEDEEIQGLRLSHNHIEIFTTIAYAGSFAQLHGLLNADDNTQTADFSGDSISKFLLSYKYGGGSGILRNFYVASIKRKYF
jgi:hypothetical protein